MFQLGANANVKLEINTDKDDNHLDVNAGTDFKLTLSGGVFVSEFTFKLDGEITYQNNVFTIKVDNEIDFFGIINIGLDYANKNRTFISNNNDIADRISSLYSKYIANGKKYIFQSN